MVVKAKRKKRETEQRKSRKDLNNLSKDIFKNSLHSNEFVGSRPRLHVQFYLHNQTCERTDKDQTQTK